MKAKKNALPDSDVESCILRFLDEHELLGERDALVAFSGGVDSSVLLTALSRLKLFRLKAIHVVHGLRPEAELSNEKRIVAALCERLDVPLEILNIRRGAIEKYARLHNTGIEDAARHFRYCALVTAARRSGVSLVFTAHNQNDRLETLLSRFMNSSSLDGFEAIHETREISKTCIVARPMLGISRKEIEEYAQANGIDFSCDSTNDNTQYYRNRIRLRLMPLLDSEFPGWRQGVLRTADKLGKDQLVIAENLAEAMLMVKIDPKKKKAEIPLAQFEQALPALQTRILTLCISRLNALSSKNRLSGSIEKRLSSRAISEAQQAIASKKSRFRILQWETTISDGVITIAPALDFIAEDGYFFLVESEGTTHIGSMEVTACWVVQESADNAPRACSGCLLYEDSFSFPIIVRTRRPGDSIELVHGLTNIEDIVKSWHISPIGRNAVPIIEDRNGIVAVLPCTEPDCFGIKPKFRNYEGPKEGRRLKIELITLKGAPTTDV